MGKDRASPRQQARRLAVLRRRADHLESRTPLGPSQADFDRAEITALRWAIEELEKQIDQQQRETPSDPPSS